MMMIYPFISQLGHRHQFQLLGLGFNRKLHASSLLVPCVESVGNYPKEEVVGKNVLVRVDSDIVTTGSSSLGCSTIHYLLESGAANVLVLSHWNPHKLLVSFPDLLSSLLQLTVICIPQFQPPPTSNTTDETTRTRTSNTTDETTRVVFLLPNLFGLKEEVANCSAFARRLVESSNIHIFVNDSFSLSPKLRASTVSIPRFCHASLAGFLFLHHLSLLLTNPPPTLAILGGANLSHKAPALHSLASTSHALLFVGIMAFQIMHALGLQVPSSLLDRPSLLHASSLVHLAHTRNIPIFYPTHFFCINSRRRSSQLFPAHAILDGWLPVDIGPNSLDDISSLLPKYKKIIWVGPVKFKEANYIVSGANTLVSTLDKLSESGCDITIVGAAACKAVMDSSSSPSVYHMIESATVFWEFLKGKKMHGLLALDRAYPHEIDWKTAYSDPAQPLVVDIGSGNGMFLLQMASRRKDLNFLGLEINHKLVRRCEDSVQKAGMKNVYFIATNATSTFRPIVSSYLGELVLVSILCPNPDFDKPEYRWRMLQRSLVEAVADLLKSEGMVYLQSDVEGVAVRMKEEFLKHSKGKLTVVHKQDDATMGEGWLMDNPFGVRSDWEQHVIDRGAPMYRLLISKSSSAN